MPTLNSKPNFNIFKEPRGFIKVIELFIAIFAFATTVGYRGNYGYNALCTDKTNKTVTQHVSVDFSYTFDEARVYVDQPNGFKCVNVSQYTQPLNYKSESEYFVFVGTTCFLYAIGAALYYTFFEDQVKDSTSTDIGICSLPVVDFAVSVLYVIFWFTASIAWAAGLSGLKNATQVGVNVALSTNCRTPNVCNNLTGATFAALNVSVLLGFLNCVVWAFNLWFLFKETPWHSPRRAANSMAGPDAEAVTQETPPASAI
ncbi:predicted protein [Nematostella vectensis]|uniref:MARVEL domain-containing protein n=1 Tax=Nematostella vectensis TaxID=45351 RepID=A7RW51_NEMVE|nr:predicted protein [Nematostella vectensis]|eukprot:XP_001636455.1 predicted protein [Nematostella vectensis]